MIGAEPLIFSDPLLAVVILALVFIGAIVQAGFGMGFGLLVAPMLALLDPALVPASALYLGTATALFGAISERHAIVWREVGIGMTGRAIGIFSGAALLAMLTDLKLFSLVFGITILGAVMLSVVGWRLAFTTFNLIGVCIVSGLTGVITSVGAPPLALIYQDRTAVSARPTLAAFFALGGALSLAVLYASGQAGWMAALGALFMFPAAILGTWTGRRIRHRLDQRFRMFLLAIAALAAIGLIFRGLS